MTLAAAAAETEEIVRYGRLAERKGLGCPAPHAVPGKVAATDYINKYVVLTPTHLPPGVQERTQAAAAHAIAVAFAQLGRYGTCSRILSSSAGRYTTTAREPPPHSSCT